MSCKFNLIQLEHVKSVTQDTIRPTLAAIASNARRMIINPVKDKTTANHVHSTANRLRAPRKSRNVYAMQVFRALLTHA